MALVESENGIYRTKKWPSKRENTMMIFKHQFSFGKPVRSDKPICYPLVNIPKTMENQHFQWENPRTKWSFSIAMLVYQRVQEKTNNIYSLTKSW